MKTETPYKCGQFVYFNNMKYLFGGYIDAKCKRAVIRDEFGNNVDVWISDLKLKKNEN